MTERVSNSTSQDFFLQGLIDDCRLEADYRLDAWRGVVVQCSRCENRIAFGKPAGSLNQGNDVAVRDPGVSRHPVGSDWEGKWHAHDPRIDAVGY